MSSHLIIGLGGTGGRVIRSLRRVLYQEYRENMDNPSGDGWNTSLEYLYADTSQDVMNEDWKVLGHDVRLPDGNLIRLRGADLKHRLENLQAYPGIRPWIGDRDVWNTVLSGMQVAGAVGGQKRRLGRFLFACGVDSFNSALKTQCRSLQRRSRDNDVTFHILCGLAGGTGGGCLIDVITQIRKEYPFEKRPEGDLNRIILYTLLPEKTPRDGWDTGNYHANGYAALLELNALSVGRYRPHDVAAEIIDPDTGTAARLHHDVPFNGCYVFSNENENGKIITDIAGDFPEIIANFLYQKIIAVKGLPWKELKDMEDAENGDGTPESEGGLPARSLRFLTFGIKRIAVPEKEIKEYLTYNYARQVLLHFKYNHWEDTQGFINTPQNTEFMEYVAQDETRRQWLLTDEHLGLSEGILPQERKNKKWNPITDEWQTVIPRMVNFVKENKHKERWLDELANQCQDRFEGTFRGMGVKPFYHAKLEARTDHAREIRRHVERDLFDEWKNGTKSMEDISSVVDALISDTDARFREIDQKLERLNKKIEDEQRNIEVNKETWPNIGILSEHLRKKHDKVLDAQSLCYERYYNMRTRIEAWKFARQLIPIIVIEFRNLKTEVDTCVSVVNQAYVDFEDRILARIKDNEEESEKLRQELYRFYDQDLVKEVNRRWITDAKVQKAQTSEARTALLGELGQAPTFGLFGQRISKESLIEKLELVCEQRVEVQHDNLQDTQEKLFNQSIVSKLEDRYGGSTNDLRNFVEEIVAYAGNYVSFDSAQVGLGAARDGIFKRNLSVISSMPEKQADRTGFQQLLHETIDQSYQGTPSFVFSDVNPYEIVFVRMANLFPLRYVTQVKHLKERYEAKLVTGGAQKRLEVHTEGDGTQFPSIFQPTQEELHERDQLQRDAAIPYLLFGKALKLFVESKNPKTGANTLHLPVFDEFGANTQNIDLGSDLNYAADNLPFEHIEIIKSRVDAMIQDEFAFADKKKELMGRLASELKEIIAQHNGDKDESVVKRFTVGYKATRTILGL